MDFGVFLSNYKVICEKEAVESRVQGGHEVVFLKRGRVKNVIQDS